MLGLPRKSENKQSVAFVKNADQGSAQTVGGRRQPTHNILVLVPTMMGSQMVMIPLPKDGRGLDWPTSIPTRD